MTELTLDRLMAMHGPEFIRAAYQTFLHRDAEESGLKFYRERLFAGVDRADLIYDLARSKEGRAVREQLQGVEKLLSRQKLLRLPILGILFCFVFHGCGKRTLKRINGLTERLADANMRSSASSSSANELEVLRNLLFAASARPVSAATLDAIDSTKAPRARFEAARQSLGKDDAGLPVPAEAAELFFPEQYRSLPPRSSAVLYMLG